MKYLFTFSLFAVLLTATLFGQVEQDQRSSVYVADGTEAMWDLQFSFDANTPTGNLNLVSAETDGSNWYVTDWTSDLIYKFDMAGNLVDSVQVPGVSATRDLAYDGTYFYGGAASNAIWEMDLATGTLVSTISLPAGVNVRSIAYDEVNDGFWVANWGVDLTLVDRNGNILNTIPNTISHYGMAYDGWSTGGPYLWIFSGTTTGGGSQVEQYEIATGNLTGTMHDVNLELGAGIAGGLYTAAEIVTGTVTLGGCMQGDPVDLVFGYEIFTIIPVEFVTFSASIHQDAVTLNWSTATETNNRGFEIQRKSGNSDFTTIGFLEGAGTTTEVHNYSFTDNSVAKGSYEYRLKQVDFNGSFSFSDPISANIESVVPEEFSLEQNYPNPFNPTTKITFGLASASDVNLSVYNVLGQEVAVLVNGSLSPGFHTVDFNAQGLQSGVYFARIEAAGIDGTNFTDIKKMVLSK